MTAKKASEAAKQKEREILFASLRQSDDSEPKVQSTDLFAGRGQQQQSKNLTQNELVVNASSDVTAALRRTHDLLASELSRSRFAQETLDQSTAALSDLGEKYNSLDSLLSSSKTLLGTLLQSQKSDTWYLETAFYLLVTTIVWLVFRRIIYGPAWFFIWLPLRYFLFQPFYYLYAAFARLASTAGGATAVNTTTSSVTRAPLRVKPSAQGGPPKFSMSGGQPPRGVPVGGGGMGAKRGPGGNDPSPDGSLSQKIGQMAEESRQEEQNDHKSGGADRPEEPIRRADGTVLESRGDKPRNPKKKMWDEDVESAKYQATQRDEL